MKIIIDTCVILDYILERDCADMDQLDRLFAWCIENNSGYITAKSCCDLHYILSSCYHSKAKAIEKMTDITTIFNVLDTKAEDVKQALKRDMTDFEDAVMVETAIGNEIDAIVTDNIKDYRQQKSVQIIHPNDWSVIE